MHIIGKLDINKLKAYQKKLITNDVIMTNERLYQHILIYHKSEYEQLRKYIKGIIEKPDYIIEDNRHNDTMIYLKKFDNLKGRIIIKLALGQDKEHNKNSIITIMKLNDRTWKQTIKNRGKIVWQKLDKIE